MPNNENFYYARLRVPLLNWLPVTAWLISPLALVGLLLGLRRLWQAWTLYALVVLSLAPLIIFYVIGRFRVVLLAAAIPFAALTLVEAARAVRERRFAPLAGIAAALLIAGLWTDRPLPGGRPLIRTDDWLAPYLIRYQPRAQAAAERGDWQAAARECVTYFSEAPDRTAVVASGDRDLPPRLAEVHMQCAAMWQRAGNEALAREQAGEAKALLDGGIIH
jgi:hypothetical protein